MSTPTIGEKVTYRDINLYDYRGTIVSLGRTPRDGDCVVQWYTPSCVAGKSEECLVNLMALPERKTA